MTAFFGPNFEAMKHAMARKDPALWAEVRGMSIPAAWRRWRAVYPEDFAGITGNEPVNTVGPHLIKDKDDPR